MPLLPRPGRRQHFGLSRLRPIVAALIGAAALAAPSAALAGTANQGVPGASASNPLAGMPMGVYTGGTDNVYPAYEDARGRNRALMARIARRPLMFWFGGWFDPAEARKQVSQYIEQTTHGNPDALSQMAVFRLDPWEAAACSGTWNAADQASYRAWTDSFAAGIGSSRVALVLQPDLPFALCAHSRVPLALVAYAARRFSALSHTTVYIDAGAADWEKVSQAAWLLRQAGVRHVRGFALNSTHYDSTGNEVRYGAAVARLLAREGVPGKHFVVNTDTNGSPFLYYVYQRQFHGSDMRVCTSRHESLCVTLGIPPTTDVASPRWGLSGQVRALAARYADAYLWIGRPWMDEQAWPFDFPRALDLAATTPF